MRFPHPRDKKRNSKAWDSGHYNTEVGGKGRDEDQRQKVLQETFGRFQNISQKSLVQKACDFFRAGEIKVGARKILSDHCPNEGEKPKGARGGEWK